MTPLDFAAALMGYCYATRASVTSWGRTVARNVAVGGHLASYHLQFLGADVVYDRTPDIAHCVCLAGRFGLQVVREGDHDHLEPRT